MSGAASRRLPVAVASVANRQRQRLVALRGPRPRGHAGQSDPESPPTAAGRRRRRRDGRGQRDHRRSRCSPRRHRGRGRARPLHRERQRPRRAGLDARIVALCEAGHGGAGRRGRDGFVQLTNSAAGRPGVRLGERRAAGTAARATAPEGEDATPRTRGDERGRRRRGVTTPTGHDRPPTTPTARTPTATTTARRRRQRRSAGACRAATPLRGAGCAGRPGPAAAPRSTAGLARSGGASAEAGGDRVPDVRGEQRLRAGRQLLLGAVGAEQPARRCPATSNARPSPTALTTSRSQPLRASLARPWCSASPSASPVSAAKPTITCPGSRARDQLDEDVRVGRERAAAAGPADPS